MEKKLDLTHLLNEDLDYSVLVYGLKLFLRSIGINIDVDPLNPGDISFTSNGKELDFRFEVDDLKFGLVLNYDIKDLL